MKIYKCDICNFISNNKTNYSSHLKTKIHTNNNNIKDENIDDSKIEVLLLKQQIEFLKEKTEIKWCS